jgi:hypothetical protein
MRSPEKLYNLIGPFTFITTSYHTNYIRRLRIVSAIGGLE